MIILQPQITPLVQENDITRSVSTTFSQCLTTQLQDAIASVSLHGGYDDVPSEQLETYFTGGTSVGIPYYFQESEDKTPAQDILQEQLAQSFLQKIEACTDFSAYPYTITTENQSAKASIVLKPLSVEAKLFFPIRIITESATYKLEDFNVEVGSNYYTLSNAATEITSIQADDPSVICFSCLAAIAEQNNFYLGMIEMHHDTQYTVIYILNDRDTTAEQPISFYFAHTFEKIEEAMTLTITPIQKQTAIIGYPYYLQIETNSKNPIFTDDAEKFDINEDTGIISFTPTAEDIGEWIVTITASDEGNKTVKETFIFEVQDVITSDIIMEPLPYFVGTIGETFNYTVTISANNTSYFTDNTTIFDIDLETGQIMFVPQKSDIGTHNFIITVIDSVGNYVEEEGYMVIVE